MVGFYYFDISNFLNGKICVYTKNFKFRIYSKKRIYSFEMISKKKLGSLIP